MKDEGFAGENQGFCFADIKLYGALPRTIEAQVLGKQVLRYPLIHPPISDMTRLSGMTSSPSLCPHGLCQIPSSMIAFI